MPEIGFGEPITSLASDIKKMAGERGAPLLTRETLNLVTSHHLNNEYLGSGRECVVVSMSKGSPGGEKLAAAFTYKDMDPTEMKRVFYAQRIMSTLFRRNFPRFYAAFGKHPQRESDKNVSGTIREKVTTYPIKPEQQKSNEVVPEDTPPL